MDWPNLCSYYCYIFPRMRETGTYKHRFVSACIGYEVQDFVSSLYETPSILTDVTGWMDKLQMCGSAERKSNWYCRSNFRCVGVQREIATDILRHIPFPCITMRGPGSVVRIATAYGLNCPGIESWCGQDFPHLSKLTLSSTSLL